MRTREERRQRAREIRWMIGIGAMLCLTFWGGMAFAFWVVGK
nr:MAG TPA: cytochrome c nitrite reductase [Caudoviricetes sp.]